LSIWLEENSAKILSDNAKLTLKPPRVVPIRIGTVSNHTVIKYIFILITYLVGTAIGYGLDDGEVGVRVPVV
jgi:hypothetical protein